MWTSPATRFTLATLTLLAAAALVAPDAWAVRVRKVDEYRWECKWSNGALTYTTAATKADARANCLASAPAANLTLDDVRDVTEATQVKTAAE